MVAEQKAIAIACFAAKMDDCFFSRGILGTGQRWHWSILDHAPWVTSDNESSCTEVALCAARSLRGGMTHLPEPEAEASIFKEAGEGRFWKGGRQSSQSPDWHLEPPRGQLRCTGGYV